MKKLIQKMTAMSVFSITPPPPHLVGKPGRAPGVFLGCIAVVLGLAFPATYGQGVTNPDTCPDATSPVAKTGVTDPANDNPSSFAAGCGAHAGTDGSVAIGDTARVELYKTLKPGGREISITHTLKSGRTTIELEAKPTNGGIEFYKVVGGVREETPLQLEDYTNYVLEKLTDVIVIPPVPSKMGNNGIAIGSESRVMGEDSIAIGPNASVVRIETQPPEPPEPPVITHTLEYEDKSGRTTIELEAKPTNSGIEFYKVVGGVREETPLQLEDYTNYVLEKKTSNPPGPRNGGEPTKMPVKRAVAVGADVKVTGDNAVAIGAGASAKANSIAIGADVEAGEKEIVIGNGKATKVEVGGMDLMGIDKNVAGNRTDIDANTGNITTNAGNITTNSAHISTNAGNIATNVGNIATNSSNINVNARDILNNKAGIAMAIALAHIPAATGGSRGSVGVGGGFFDGKEAIAIGASFRVGDRGQAKLGISHSSGETGGGVGVGFNF